MEGDNLRTYPNKAQAMVLYLLVISLPWPIKTSVWALVLFLFVSVVTIRSYPRYTTSQLVFAGACLLYFSLHFFYFLSSPTRSGAWFEVEKKLSFLFLPFLFLNKSFRVNQVVFLNTLICYVVSVSLASLTCLLYAVYSYFKWGTVQYFYYHDLSHIIRQHAVYFSMQIIIAIAGSYTLFMKTGKMPALFIGVVSLLVLTLLLLSSKIMIVSFFILIILLLGKSYLSGFRRKGLAVAIGVSLVLLLFVGFNRHITSRFKDISFDKIALVKQERYNPQIYFDGFILRLIQIKFAWHILNEQQAWIVGVGPARSQELLNAKYAESGMYTGAKNESGYIGLNFHDQYVETTVRFGLVGLLLLLTLIGVLIRHAFRSKNAFLLVVTLLFSVFFFTESVLETERGLVTFLFFTCLLQKDYFAPKRIYDKKDI